MVVLDDDFTVDATLAEGGAIWSPPRPTRASASHDYRALYERERARAESAEARCEELRWAEVATRRDAGSWKARFKSCRSKRDAAIGETKKLRREVKAGAPGLHREVTRLRKELSRALAEPSAATTRIRENRFAALEAENLQQMRYAVHDRNGWPLAMLGFSTAAWKLAPRDNFIGWTPELREKNLPLVVDNPRFLILPWVAIPNLGSHILALVRRRLPTDWTERYRTTPGLIETFVETPRYTGAVDRASGWTHVGTTQGRGRYDRDMLFDKPRKDIWLRPLQRLAAHTQSVKSSPPSGFGNAFLYQSTNGTGECTMTSPWPIVATSLVRIVKLVSGITGTIAANGLTARFPLVAPAELVVSHSAAISYPGLCPALATSTVIFGFSIFGTSSTIRRTWSTFQVVSVTLT